MPRLGKMPAGVGERVARVGSSRIIVRGIIIRGFGQR